MNKLFIKAVAVLGIATFVLTFKDLKVYETNFQKKDLVAYNTENNFKIVNREEILSYFDEEEAVIYIGSIDEEHNVILDILSDLSRDYGINNLICYDSTKESPKLSLDTERSYKVDREPTSFYYDMLDKVGFFALDYDVINTRNEAIKTDYKIIVNPTVFFVKNGKINFSYFIENLKLSDKELNDVKDIYVQGFENIKVNV